MSARICSTVRPWGSSWQRRLAISVNGSPRRPGRATAAEPRTASRLVDPEPDPPFRERLTERLLLVVGGPFARQDAARCSCGRVNRTTEVGRVVMASQVGVHLGGKRLDLGLVGQGLGGVDEDLRLAHVQPARPAQLPQTGQPGRQLVVQVQPPEHRQVADPSTPAISRPVSESGSMSVGSSAHEPAGAGHGAADRDGHHPPGGGAAAAAPGGDGGGDHLHRRGDQAGDLLRRARGRRPGGLGGQLPQRGAGQHGRGLADGAVQARRARAGRARAQLPGSPWRRPSPSSSRPRRATCSWRARRAC